MPLTKYAIESLGFKPIPPGETLNARFHSLNVFSALGFNVPDNSVSVHSASARGLTYAIGIGTSVNAICTALVGDTYTDEDDSWESKRNAHPPFVMVHIPGSTRHTAAIGYAKHDGHEITTYDTFSAAKDELRSHEQRILPSIEAALAYVFSSVTESVVFRHVHKTYFGTTDEGMTIHDLSVSGHAELLTSQQLVAEDLEGALRSVADLAPRLNPRATRFFQLAVRDGDNLKRFLYHFLAVEIEVHKVFGGLHVLHTLPARWSRSTECRRQSVNSSKIETRTLLI